MNSRIALILIVLIAMVTSNQCTTSMSKTKGKLVALFQTSQAANVNDIIDQVAAIAKEIPLLLDDCGQKEYSKEFKDQLPSVCIDELSQAMKIIYRLLQESKNQVKFTIDLALLERVLQKKIKKDCPFWHHLNLNEVKDKGTCMQAVYDESLLVQKAVDDKLNEHSVTDWVNAFNHLPPTLDKCNQSQLADTIRRDLPKECLTSIGVFAQFLQQVQRNYDHFEWLLYHYKEMYRDYKQIVYTCPIFGMLNQPKQQALQTTNGPTYDFMAPFKDYNNQMKLSLQGISSGQSVSFTANFRQNTGWGNCFGYGVYSMKFSTTQVGNKYVTVITQSTGKTLNLAQPCDIMGTNSGEAQVFPGVAVPIVTAVSVDGVALSMLRPCESTGCKDPLNGYTNAGYYAQWAVWGRQYNPYEIPFDKINQIFYAFIGFNPGDGSIKSLDSSADGWGMSAIARAMLQYPYLRAHLSFGGWTNNGATCAPMFEQLSSNQASMDRFANQSVALMRKLGFNGIDIDWEWWSDYKDQVAPAKKVLQFYKTLRKAIDQASQEDGKTYRLSSAVNGGTSRILAMQNSINPNSVPNFWEQCNVLLDQLNIMNYDYHGAWDVGTPSYFQAPFDYENVPDDIDIGKQQGWDIKSSVQTYIDNGISANKILIGLVLDGRTMQVNSATNGGLLQTVKGPGFGDYENGILDYKCIINPVFNPATGCGSDQPVSAVRGLVFYDQTHNTDIWNVYGKDALQTWAFNPTTMAFLTYQTVWSVTEKTKLVKLNKLMGTMFWQLDGDMHDDRSLIATAKKVLTS